MGLDFRKGIWIWGFKNRETVSSWNHWGLVKLPIYPFINHECNTHIKRNYYISIVVLRQWIISYQWLWSEHLQRKKKYNWAFMGYLLWTRVLPTLKRLLFLIFKIILWGRYYPHFTEKEIEEVNSWKIYLMLHI